MPEFLESLTLSLLAAPVQIDGERLWDLQGSILAPRAAAMGKGQGGTLSGVESVQLLPARHRRAGREKVRHRRGSR